MAAWTTLKVFLNWLVVCVRAWFEVGSRLRALEDELQLQTGLRSEEDARIRQALATAVESERTGREKIYLRIEELDRLQVDRMAAADRALQQRIDEWALQLSGQMNGLYAAIARSPIHLADD